MGEIPFFSRPPHGGQGSAVGVLCLAEDPKLEGVFAHTAASSLDTQLVIATDKRVYNCSQHIVFKKNIMEYEKLDNLSSPQISVKLAPFAL